MQVPVIHMLNHLQKQNPSFLSQIQNSYNLCKWGALVFALLATFRIIIKLKSSNILIIGTPSIPLLTNDDDDDYSDTDDDNDNDNETMSSSEFEDEDEDEEEDRTTGEYFRLRGDGGFLRRRSIGDLFSLSEIANIGFGLRFVFDHSEEQSVVSLYEHKQRIRPIIPTGKPPTTTAISCASPAVGVSAGENESGNLGLRIWDTRLRRRIPAVIAEWGPTLGKTVGVESGGVHKVYVRDNGLYGLTVGDIRNVKSPLENITESHVDTWWPNSFMLKLH